MAEIRHLVNIDAPAERVYEAVSRPQGVARWWTPSAGWRGDPGSIIHTEFRTGGFGDFAVRENDPAHVRWECIDNDSREWIGTDVVFDIEDRGEVSTLRFGHLNWPDDAADFMASCNYFWGYFMRSIKDLAETGVGKPR